MPVHLVVLLEHITVLYYLYVVDSTSLHLFVLFLDREFANHRALRYDADDSFERVRGAWRLVSSVRDTTNNG